MLSKIFVRIEINLIEMMKVLFKENFLLYFLTKKLGRGVVFDRETKIFITAYKIAERSVNEYLTSGSIGEKL